MLKADLHIHTRYSMDCDMKLEKIIKCCQERDINCIAIADHGTIEGALEMQRIAPFSIIVAEEILTTKGEIMGMFLTETIPSGLSVIETIDRIKAQGALVNIPHPFDVFRQSALESSILRTIIKQIDVIEVLNARYILHRSMVKANYFAKTHGIPQSAGSDAHTFNEIGNAYLEMPEFTTSKDFIQSINESIVCGHRTNPVTHFGSTWSKLKVHFRKDD